MTKKSRFICLLLSVIMIASVFQTALPFMTVHAEENVSSYLMSPDPGVSVSCSEITWVSAGKNSYSPGNVIVPATESGIPLVNESSGDETASYTTIVAKFTNLPENQPTISCTSGGTGLTFTSPNLNKKEKTYTWQLLSGSAEDGSVLEFSIVYKFNSKNYTNKAYSFVRNITQPAGVYMARKNCVKEYYWSSSVDAGVNFISRLVGRNLYTSLTDLASSSAELFRGYYNVSGNTVNPSDGSAYSVVGTIKQKDNLTTSNSYYLDALIYKPSAVVYLDTSRDSSLSDLNLRVITNIIGKWGDNDSQLITTSASGALGYNGGDSLLFAGQQSVRRMSGTVTSGSYSITATGTGQKDNAWVRIEGGINLSIQSYDKSSLRTLIQKIYAGNLYSQDNPFSSFGCNKGVQPQSWQFKSGWNDFDEAMRNAMGILLNPAVGQDQIDGAVTALNSAYGNLQIKKADYSVYEQYAELIDAAIEKDNRFFVDYGEHWYVPETLDNLKSVYDSTKIGINILYQPQVDKWTEDLAAAYEQLEVLPADYTTLNEVVAHANELGEQKLSDGSSIYVNFSDVAAALAAVRYDLTKEDQEQIETYIRNINDAVNNLVVRTADYTQVELMVQKAKALKASNYTNFNKVRAAVNAVRYNLKVTAQERVDTFAANINTAINDLIPKDADYTRIEALIAQANALVQEYYTPATYSAVTRAVNKASNYRSYSILDQTKVDTLANNIDDAIKALVMYDADYSSVEEAIASWESIPESEKSKLQATSIQAVDSAINAVTYGLKIDRQREVDEYAERIRNAIDSIEYLMADYSGVEAAISRAEALDRTYWADMSAVDNAVNAVQWNLGLNRQDEVDGFATAILDAINQLVPGPADYSRVNAAIARFEAINKNYYTIESVQAVEDVINSINWNLTKANQTTVIIYAYDLNEAMLNLVEADGDYKRLNSVMEALPSNLDGLYTQESLKGLRDVIDSINWNLKAKDQATIDKYVTDIRNACDALVYLPGDYSEVDRQIAIGREMISNGVKQPDGSYYAVSAASAREFEAFVARIDRSYNIVQTEQIAAIAASVKAKYEKFEYDESIHNAKIKVSTDKDVTYQGDTVTVTIAVKTDYYAAAIAVPVLYNSEYYEIEGNGIDAYTFADNDYTNSAEKSGTTLSPEKGYPSTYSSSDKQTWKYAYVSLAPSSALSATPFVLDPETTIATFTLKVKDDVQIGDEAINSRIWVDRAFLKTQNNKGGKLYVGRYTQEVVNFDSIGYGQTIDLTEADVTVKIYDVNSPAVMDELLSAIANVPAYDESFYTEETYYVYALALEAGQAIADEAESYSIVDQQVVDEAAENIVNALAALVLKEADTTPLEAAVVRIPEYSQNLYTSESYAVYTQAIENGSAILQEDNLTIADNERISAAAKAIDDALSSLTLKDCTYMEEILDAINNQSLLFEDSAYDENALNEYYDAYDMCYSFTESDKTVLDDEEGLQVLNNFNEKYVALEKSALQKEIDSCTAQYDASVYEEASYNEYVSALTDARAIINNNELGRDDATTIYNCAQTLNTKFNALVIKSFMYEDEVWQALDLFPQDEEHTVAESLDAYYEAYNALDEFVTEYSEKWTALQNEEALTLLNNLHEAYDNLIIEPANISQLLVAINQEVYDESFYTQESYEAYANAISAGRALTNATYDRQDEVDNATQAINDAYNNLVLKPFTKLGEVNETLENVPSKTQGEYIESFWQAYACAKTDLEAIVANAQSLTIADDQDAVNKIEAYNSALAELEENGVAAQADYSSVTQAIENANAKLAQMQSTGNELVASTVSALTAAIDAVDYTLTGAQQDTINAYATSINAAADALEFVAKIFIEDSYKDVVTIEDGFVYGLSDIASEDDILNAFGCIGDSTIEIKESQNGYGTGTIVKLIDNKTSEVIVSYTIVVLADANGDGFVDSFDESIITQYINAFENPPDEAVFKALDVVQDGWLDAIDLAYVMYIANYEQAV